MPKSIDETGKRFNQLVVIACVGKKNYNSSSKKMWLCQCDCGNTIITPIGPLKNGRTKSCGCYGKTHKWNKTHGMSNTRLFHIWANMIDRCTNKKSPRYKDYGGRGISVCDEWCGENGSSNFISWAKSNGYKENLTLDRIDNDKKYEPLNCRWTSYKKQARNKRTNRILEYNGQSHCVAEWSDITGIKQQTILRRLKRGWSVEDTLTIPKGQTPNYKEFKEGE